MHRHHRFVLSCLVALVLPGTAWAGKAVSPKWSLIEQGAEVLAFSPDGGWLVTWTSRNEPVPDESGARYRRRLRLLDPETGQVQITIPTPVEVWGDPRWKFSPDGRTLAVSYVEGASSDPGIGERPRTVVFWDLPRR